MAGVITISTPIVETKEYGSDFMLMNISAEPTLQVFRASYQSMKDGAFTGKFFTVVITAAGCTIDHYNGDREELTTPTWTDVIATAGDTIAAFDALFAVYAP